MNEKTQEKLNLLKQTQAKLKDVSHQQQSIIEHLADLQTDLMNANQDTLSNKIADAFSAESKNKEAIDSALEDLDISINQLHNE